MLAALIVSAGLLTGCDAFGEAVPTGAPTPTPTAPAGEPGGDVAAVLVPDGSAADNLALFTRVTADVWASPQRDSGRAYVDALTAAGFDRSRMQVTADRSTVGNPAESLQFSVAWDQEQCLIGQVGPSTGEPVTAVMDQLAEGRCLVGATRPIDW